MSARPPGAPPPTTAADPLEGQEIESTERLFHFETLLKAIERFFNPANHPARTRRGLAFDESLADELLTVERHLGFALRATQNLLKEGDADAMIFQQYVESQWVTDEARDFLLTKHAAQESVEDSLFLLQEGLLSLYHLARGLRGSGDVNVLRYDALGRQYRSLVANNRYFSPFRNPRLHLAAPSSRRHHLRRCLQAASSNRMRRAMTFVIAVLERYLYIVGHINPKVTRREELLDGLPYLALVRSEFRVTQQFLEETFVERWLPGGPTDDEEREFWSRVDSLAFELGAVLHRAFDELLLDFCGGRSTRRMRGALEAVHGLLTVFLEQALVSVLSFGLPGTTVRQVFPDAEIRAQESKRLREDLWIFGEVLGHVIARLQDPNLPPETKQLAYRGLLDFLTYFENLGYQLVRYPDREAFEHFFGDMRSLREELFADQLRCGDVAVNFECFRIFIHAVLGHVGLRADLRDVRFDEDRARSALRQFIYDKKD